ncbi:carbohydrate ABC transporter permease [Paenibacillus dokdonensis]|uniref:Carbohydrate ABC transporter permease n=1 Tax=Paenibacillus dokdonensis TaxID=2567944 RepID=A0ABU6GJW6_9BACL|nr:carbohydrate ABC transporter permease [Paenibacillus dokdonensis]MEC0240003.1 carbohydrate ABC transporter permease [Paenibacillus dokdonensis]
MRDTLGEKTFNLINYALLSLFGLICLLPILNIISVSFSDSHAVASGRVSLWPSGFSLDSYKALFVGTGIFRALINNVEITIIGVVLSMIATIMAAYPLSRSYFYGRRLFTLGIVFTMLFGGGLIPSYLVIQALGLIDHYSSLWLPGLVSAFNMLVLKTHFENLPVEMEEAARIDGCNEWRLIGQIFLPLSMPVLAALTLFYAVGYWNSFMNVLIYINSPEKHNLTVLVQQMIYSQSLLSEINNVQPDEIQQLTPDGMKSAGIVVMIAPLLAVYPFLQKYFVKGVMIGAIKG